MLTILVGMRARKVKPWSLAKGHNLFT